MQSSPIIDNNQETLWLEKLVRSQIIENWEMQDEPQHLKTIRDRLLQSANAGSFLQLIATIFQQGQILLDCSEVQRELILTGIVKQKQQYLVSFNPIYQEVFGRAISFEKVPKFALVHNDSFSIRVCKTSKVKSIPQNLDTK